MLLNPAERNAEAQNLLLESFRPVNFDSCFSPKAHSRSGSLQGVRFLLVRGLEKQRAPRGSLARQRSIGLSQGLRFSADLA
jgi:hypothetical protein